LKALPASIVQRLEASGCAVPQVDAPFIPTPKGQMNVIRGEFARPGQVDWAVVCLKGSSSTILMFWGKIAACPSELAAEKDFGDRWITSVKEAELLGYADPPTPGLMKHQGIDDATPGKGSTVYYCTDGQWKVVAGAD
jgi:hypothetical protein